MRLYSILGSIGVAALAFASSGCEKKTMDAVTEAINKEMMRVGYIQAYGPLVVSSAVALATPPGPSALNFLCADANWRHLLTQTNAFPDLQPKPSLLVMPDPNRPIQLSTIGTVDGK